MSSFFTTKPLPNNATWVGLIMAGGSGTRFWPLSRKDKPKQFLSLTEGQSSLIQLTTQRLEAIGDSGVIAVSAGDSHKKQVLEQLPNVSLILEPMARNTAPCLLLASLKVLQEIGDVPMLCVPSDHLIKNDDRFVQLATTALEITRSSELLLTIGIKPKRPDVGYGYIKVSQTANKASSLQVDSFIEKPDKETAKRYILEGNYYWNSGIFAWLPSVFIAEYGEKLPGDVEAINNLKKAIEARDSQKLRKAFSSLTAISVDFGILEKSQKIAMIPAENLGWSDIGTWTSWSEIYNCQNGENEIDGKGIIIESKGCLVLSRDKFTAICGVKDLVVVVEDDVVLVCQRNKGQLVREVVSNIKKIGREDLL